MSLDTYLDKFNRLVVNVKDRHESPHKPCMLLALLDMARAGALTENRVAYDPQLLERYRSFFDAARGPEDHPNPYFPFFHLSGRLRGGAVSFWHLEPLPGREQVLAAMSTARSSTDITSNVAYAWLDPELHQLLQVPTAVDALEAALVKRWFNREVADLHAVVERSSQISRYEHDLRQGLVATERPAPAYVRNPAFRRVVAQSYDYRCAATGVRILLPTGEAMVEAAHIHPFRESGDDDPRNGIALTPNMHWAFDHNLIAPSPDFCWRVSDQLDARIPDYRELRDLDGKRLFLPSEARWYPRRDVLEWRLARLRDSGWTAADPQCVDEADEPGSLSADLNRRETSNSTRQ
jgi:putative restriction endonuclease